MEIEQPPHYSFSTYCTIAECGIPNATMIISICRIDCRIHITELIAIMFIHFECGWKFEKAFQSFRSVLMGIVFHHDTGTQCSWLRSYQQNHTKISYNDAPSIQNPINKHTIWHMQLLIYHVCNVIYKSFCIEYNFQLIAGCTINALIE